MDRGIPFLYHESSQKLYQVSFKVYVRQERREEEEEEGGLLQESRWVTKPETIWTGEMQEIY